jgi:type I restriction enzyme M protein
LRYEVTEEAIARLRGSKVFKDLTKPVPNAKQPTEAIARGEAVQSALLDGLRALNGFATTDRSQAEIKVRNVLRAIERPSAGLRKAVWDALAVRDDAAPVVTNGKGQPQSDPALRDSETVPLRESVADYMRREVLPFVEDAWVNESNDRIGAELPVTRVFYQHQPPRSLETIDAEIRALEEEIAVLTSQVTGR